MRRTKFAILATITLWFAVMSLVLFSGKHTLTPISTHSESGKTFRVVLNGGIEFIEQTRETASAESRGTDSEWTLQSKWYAQHPDTDHELAGFEWLERNGIAKIGKGPSEEIYATTFDHAATLPAWFVIFVTGLIGVVSAWKAIRPAPGYCETCGFKLRAAFQSCPQCGRSAAARQK